MQTSGRFASRAREHFIAIALLLAGGIASSAPSSSTKEIGIVANPPVISGTDRDKLSEYEREWPQGRPALYKLSNQLVFAIPPQYQPFWLQKDRVVRAPADPKTIPQVQALVFQFFMPDFSGYTPHNFMNEFDDDRVDVVYIEPADPAQMQPGAPGYYPPNMLARALAAYLSADHFVDLYGLRCYAELGALDRPRRRTCYGRRDEHIQEDIMLDAYFPPFDAATVHPLIQAQYFTKQFGGLVIVWRTSVKNFPRWHEIDAKIWQYLAEWHATGNALIDKSSK